MNVDVLIVGYGPVGAAFANLLGQNNVSALAIDSATQIYDKPRAISLDSEALRILQAVGVAGGELELTVIPKVQYYSPYYGEFVKMNTGFFTDTHPALVCFYQPDLEKLLRKKLESFDCVQTMLGVRLESFEQDASHVNAKLARLDGTTIEVKCKYIVGCDGASSKVRQVLGIEFEGKSFQQDWLIVDAKNVPRPIDHVEFICDPKRPGPRMAAPGGRQRWEFMLHPHENREAMQKPAAIRSLLAPWCDVDDIEIERTAVYRFHARMAQKFSKGRAFLAGDAAHIMPPFAGQGLVSGLRDASNLAWKISWVLQKKISANMLNSYDVERHPHAKKILMLALILGKINMPSTVVMARILHGLIWLARWIPGYRSLIEDMKLKPENTFSRGLFRHVRNQSLFRAGSSLPQVLVRNASAANVLKSDDAIGSHFALIGLHADPSPHLSQQSVNQWQQVGGKICYWHREGDLACPAAESHAERLEIIGNGFDKKIPRDGWLVVIRPDRCILLEGPIQRANQIIQESLNLLTMD